MAKLMPFVNLYVYYPSGYSNLITQFTKEVLFKHKKVKKMKLTAFCRK